ncbi:hypothetical protein LR013_04425 [candidate division NPL-UPA2 bacterium]|nr:hypothetical protein [candidate division NPL-UPA2 bacterium]
MESKEVRIRKVDLDTIGAAYLLGVTRADNVQIVRGEVAIGDLVNPEVICLEVGGSGQIQLMNFDHHGENAPRHSAAWQALRYKNRFINAGGSHKDRLNSGFAEYLAKYIDIMDVEGPGAFRRAFREVKRKPKDFFPYLSDVISGILLVETDPLQAFFKGIEALESIRLSILRDEYKIPLIFPRRPLSEEEKISKDSLASLRYFPDGHLVRRGEDEIPLFGRVNLGQFQVYREARAEYHQQAGQLTKLAGWDTTRTGLKLSYLETKFFGIPGKLYGCGAQVVVALNPDYNGVRKFTIAGKNIKVEVLKGRLNARELGWGGPSTGTILGSPWRGSRLSLPEVIKIVKQAL